MKIHFFNIAGLIKDVELLGQSTIDNLDKIQRRVNVREKWKTQGKLTYKRLGNVWKNEMKYLISSLERSLDRLNNIIGKLKTLEENCLRSKEKIADAVKFIRKAIEDKITMKHGAIIQ